MTTAELANRNRSLRMAQLSRLRPVLTQAKEAQSVLREARERAKDGRGSFELMQKLKHVPNFFPTPKPLVARMIEAADIDPGMAILEPSAGKGDIADAIWEQGRREAAIGADMISLHCIEIVHSLAEHLRKKPYGANVMCSDFLTVFRDPRTRLQFDRVIMNPPFERGIDEDHILHAYEFLKSGGRLVAICCSTTARKLDPWLADHSGYSEPLEEGTFARSERPTNVNTCLIVADR